MADEQEDLPRGRPKRRDKTVGVRVDADTLTSAQKKAKKSGRSLSSILNSFLHLWTMNEIGDPPVLPQEGVRAEKRRRKPKADE